MGLPEPTIEEKLIDSGLTTAHAEKMSKLLKKKAFSNYKNEKDGLKDAIDKIYEINQNVSTVYDRKTPSTLAILTEIKDKELADKIYDKIIRHFKKANIDPYSNAIYAWQELMLDLQSHYSLLVSSQIGPNIRNMFDRGAAQHEEYLNRTQHHRAHRPNQPTYHSPIGRDLAAESPIEQYIPIRRSLADSPIGSGGYGKYPTPSMKTKKRHRTSRITKKTRNKIRG